MSNTKKIIEWIILIVLGSLIAISCETQDIITDSEIIVNTSTSFETDELYGRLNNDSTVEDYIDVFLEDAKRHGIDYTGLIESINVRWDEGGLFTTYYGGSWNASDPYNIDIMIGKEFWEALNFNGTFKDGRYSYPSPYFRSDEHVPYFKLKIIYHELGHDILGFTHTCSAGHIMTDNDPCGRKEGIPGDRFGLYNLATLEYLNEENKLLDWHRAVDDLFSGEEQIFTHNRSSFFN